MFTLIKNYKHELQHGFLKGSSTIYGLLLQVLHELCLTLDMGGQTDIAYLDSQFALTQLKIIWDKWQVITAKHRTHDMTHAVSKGSTVPLFADDRKLNKK